jgi:hypothetical protein
MEIRKKAGLIFGCIYLLLGLIGLIFNPLNPESFLSGYINIPFIIFCCGGTIYLFLAVFNKSPPFTFSKGGLFSLTTGVVFGGTISIVSSVIYPALFPSFFVLGIFLYSFVGFFPWLYFQQRAIKKTNIRE